MRRIHQIACFILIVTMASCSFNRTNSSPPRSVYEVVQLRRTAARLAKLARANNTHKARYFNDQPYTVETKVYRPADIHREYFIEPLKIASIICGITIGSMVLIVSLCICLRYYGNKNPDLYIDHRRPNLKPRSTQYTFVTKDERNFQRKTRHPRSAV